MNFLDAICTEEGGFKVGSRSWRNNNPGNMNWGAFARAHGATRIEEIPAGFNESPRFACFPDPATGRAALKALLRSFPYAGMSVRQCLDRFAPAADGNDVSAYEAFICSAVGCQPTDCIDPLVEAS